MADKSLREALELARNGCGSAIWLLNNRHNKNLPEWEAIADGAYDDVCAGYDSADAALRSGDEEVRLHEALKEIEDLAEYWQRSAKGPGDTSYGWCASRLRPLIFKALHGHPVEYSCGPDCAALGEGLEVRNSGPEEDGR